MKTGDLVIAVSACPVDGATRTYLHGDPYAPTADFALTHALYHAAQDAGIPVWVGSVASVDVFYNPDTDYTTKWRDRGVLAFEMEASALFYLAARAGVQAACMLTVSDLMSEEVSSEESYLAPEALATAVDSMIEVALIAAPNVERLRHKPR
jgi:purine-nucleoside phosphorylase